MNPTHQQILKSLSEKESLPAYAILWFDEGEQFLFGGNTTLTLGLLTYGQQALRDYIAKRKPLVEIPNLSNTIVSPEGQA